MGQNAMSGPWEEYAKPVQTTPEGPWTAFQKPAEARKEPGVSVTITPKAADPRDNLFGKVDAAVRGVADAATFGFADELSAGLQTGAGLWGDYDQALAAERGIDAADAENRPVSRIAGQVAGGVAGGVGLAKAGLSLGVRSAQSGGGLARVAGASAADGAILGGLAGAGGGEGAEGRFKGATNGVLLGGAAGAATPYAVAGAAKVISPMLAPILARLRPDDYAGRALAEGLERAGKSPDEIARLLEAAGRDGQGMFNVADALGNPGQRMLSTVARNPSNARGEVVDALQTRQAGQGRRVAGALAEGFDAPDTAAQRTATLTRARSTAADAGYDAARQDAGMVDVSGALQQIEDVVRPGVNQVADLGSQLADDTVEGALNRARSLLGNGREQLVDFDGVLRAKQDIDDMIGRATRAGSNNVARNLIRVREQIDAALEAASEPYGAARDAFRQGSREIDAVDAGRTAATRGRAEDTVPRFSGMSPGEQQAFRAGYADPLIEQAQGAAVGVNKARPLINDATALEFPAIAAPGRGDQLQRRLGREATMFETNGAALGGSKTADNLADAADMGRFDPGIMGDLSQGRLVKAGVAAVMKALNETKGLPAPVIERLGRVLIETRPDVARSILEQAQRGVQQSGNQRALASSILTALEATSAGRSQSGPLRVNIP
jgi:hypothetical protein